MTGFKVRAAHLGVCIGLLALLLNVPAIIAADYNSAVTATVITRTFAISIASSMSFALIR